MQVVDQYNALRGNKLTPAALVVGGLSERRATERPSPGSAAWLSPLRDAWKISSIADWSISAACKC